MLGIVTFRRYCPTFTPISYSVWFTFHCVSDLPLTHWGQDKMDAILQMIFSSAFSWIKMFEFWLKFHWSLFLRVQLTLFQHWFRQWLGAGQASSHYLKQWCLVYWCIYVSLGLNELKLIGFRLTQWSRDRVEHHYNTVKYNTRLNVFMQCYDRTYTRFWTHKRHPYLWGVHCKYFGEKWSSYNAGKLQCIYCKHFVEYWPCCDGTTL